MPHVFLDSVCQLEGLATMLGLLFTIIPGIVSRQTSANANATLGAQILMGLSISSSGCKDGMGKLDFGLVTTGNTSTVDAKTSPAASLHSLGGSTMAAIKVSHTSHAATLSDSMGNQLSCVSQVVGPQPLASQPTAFEITSGPQVVIGSSNSYFIWAGGTYAGTFNLMIAY